MVPGKGECLLVAENRKHTYGGVIGYLPTAAPPVSALPPHVL